MHEAHEAVKYKKTSKLEVIALILAFAVIVIVLTKGARWERATEILRIPLPQHKGRA